VVSAGPGTATSPDANGAARGRHAVDDTDDAADADER